MFPIVSPHVCLCWMVRPPSWRLVSHCPPLPPIVSHCLPACVPVLDGVLSCLPVLVCPPSQGLVPPCLPLNPLSHCLPTHLCLLLDGVSSLPRSCLPLSPIVSPHVCLCWMVRPPSCRLVSPFCLPLSPFLSIPVSGCLQLFPIVSMWSLIVSPHVCLCWMVRLLEVLFFIVSLEMCACVGASALDGVSAFPRSCLPFCLVSHLPSCFPLLDGVSAFPMSCLGLSPIVSSHVRLCCVVCQPPRGLVSTCLPLSPQLSPIVSLLVSPSPLVSGCVPLFPIVPPHVRLCWMVCPPSEVLSPHCLSLSPHIGARVGWCLRLGSYPPSMGLVSAYLPSSPHTCACVGWCVRLPKVLSPLSPSLSSFLSPSLSPNLSFFLFPFGVGGLILHFFFKQWSVLLRVLKAFLRCPPVGWSCLLSCLPACLSSCFPLWWVVSFSFFSKQCTVKGS